MKINKPIPPILTNKYQKNVVEVYYRFKEAVKGNGIGLAFYILITDNREPYPTYEIFPLSLQINDEKNCLESINRIMQLSSFVRWI